MTTLAYTNALAAAERIPDVNLSNQVVESIKNRGDFTESVQAFHSLYECPDDTALGTTVGAVHMSDERLKLRVDLIEEEFDRELRPAVAARNEVEMADALADIIYVAVGFALELGVNIKDIIQEVQASNMTKLDADGTVIRREDGKILKGPNYVKPNIKAVLKYRD